MKRIRGANLKSQHAAEIIDAHASMQSLTETECRIALESLEAKRDAIGMVHSDFITILALRMRVIEFESVIT